MELVNFTRLCSPTLHARCSPIHAWYSPIHAWYLCCQCYLSNHRASRAFNGTVTLTSYDHFADGTATVLLHQQMALCGNFDIVLDQFSRTFLALCHPTHAARYALLVAMLIGC